MLRKSFVSLLACGLLPAAVPALGNNLPAGDEQVLAFAERMASEHGFAADDIRAVLADAEVQQRILDAISRPAEKTKPWHEYRKIFLTEERIARAPASGRNTRRPLTRPPPVSV